MSLLTLSLDTSSASGSIALVRDGELAAEWTVGDVGTHAYWLMQSVDELLKNRGLSIHDVDRFAITVGPGSFTGLRIGISTVKGLAWALGRDITGVSTLKALSANIGPTDRTICPVLDARKKEVYSALYRYEGTELVAFMEDSACKPAELVERITETVEGPVIFIGSGLRVYGEYLLENVANSVAAPEPLWHPRASNIALLADKEGAVIAQASELTPLYLRKSEAEIKLKHAKKPSRA